MGIISEHARLQINDILLIFLIFITNECLSWQDQWNSLYRKEFNINKLVLQRLAYNLKKEFNLNFIISLFMVHS